MFFPIWSHWGVPWGREGEVGAEWVNQTDPFSYYCSFWLHADCFGHFLYFGENLFGSVSHETFSTMSLERNLAVCNLGLKLYGIILVSWRRDKDKRTMPEDTNAEKQIKKTRTGKMPAGNPS